MRRRPPKSGTANVTEAQSPGEGARPGAARSPWLPPRASRRRSTCSPPGFAGAVSTDSRIAVIEPPLRLNIASHHRGEQCGRERGGGEDVRERAPGRRNPPRQDGIMITAIALPGDTASTFLTGFFGSDLSDDTHVVERFKVKLDGDIRRCAEEPPAAQKDRRWRPLIGDEAQHARRQRYPAFLPTNSGFNESCFDFAGIRGVPATSWRLRPGSSV